MLRTKETRRGILLTYFRLLPDLENIYLTGEIYTPKLSSTHSTDRCFARIYDCYFLVVILHFFGLLLFVNGADLQCNPLSGRLLFAAYNYATSP